MSCSESLVTRLEATTAIAALALVDKTTLDVGPAIPAFFCASSANYGFENFVTELPSQPASANNLPN